MAKVITDLAKHEEYLFRKIEECVRAGVPVDMTNFRGCRETMVADHKQIFGVFGKRKLKEDANDECLRWNVTNRIFWAEMELERLRSITGGALPNLTTQGNEGGRMSKHGMSAPLEMRLREEIDDYITEAVPRAMRRKRKKKVILKRCIHNAESIANPIQETSAREVVADMVNISPMDAAKLRLAEKRRTRLVVRGIIHHGYDCFGGTFVPGAMVHLEREPDNPHDPNAVRVILSDGSMLGYLAREMAASVSKDLFDGVTYVTRVSTLRFVPDLGGQCELEIVERILPW